MAAAILPCGCRVTRVECGRCCGRGKCNDPNEHAWFGAYSGLCQREKGCTLRGHVNDRIVHIYPDGATTAWGNDRRDVRDNLNAQVVVGSRKKGVALGNVDWYPKGQLPKNRRQMMARKAGAALRGRRYRTTIKMSQRTQSRGPQ